MDRELLAISRAYARRNGSLSKEAAYEEVLRLYELYTGEEVDVPEYEPGLADQGLAKGAAMAARATAVFLKLGLLKYPAALLARQGVHRAREGMRLIEKIRDDRKALEPLEKPRRPRWQIL